MHLVFYLVKGLFPSAPRLRNPQLQDAHYRTNQVILNNTIKLSYLHLIYFNHCQTFKSLPRVLLCKSLSDISSSNPSNPISSTCGQLLWRHFTLCDVTLVISFLSGQRAVRLKLNWKCQWKWNGQWCWPFSMLVYFAPFAKEPYSTNTNA